MQVNLSIKVKTNANVSGEDVAKILRRLIDAGLSDARSTVESGEGDLKAAELATDLNISAPVVTKEPRVLVTVNGGIADYVADAGVDVEVFDHDNYKDDPEGTGGVPAHFADLAEPIDVAVEAEAVAG
jgi:hypothetical protein